MVGSQRDACGVTRRAAPGTGPRQTWLRGQRRHLPRMFQNIPGLGPAPTPGPEPSPPLVCRSGLSCSPLAHLPERNAQSMAFNRPFGRTAGERKEQADCLRGRRTAASERGCWAPGGERHREADVLAPRASLLHRAVWLCPFPRLHVCLSVCLVSLRLQVT